MLPEITWDWNQIAGAVLAGVLFLVGLGLLAYGYWLEYGFTPGTAEYEKALIRAAGKHRNG